MHEQEDSCKIQHLAGEICLTLKRERASSDNGNLALLSVVLASLIYDGNDKQSVLSMIDEMWDSMLPSFEGWKKDHAN